MGKVHSKAVGVAMSLTRSGSFDSVNTAASTGTEHPFIYRSNSMDSLILKKTHSSHAHSKSSPPKRREEGKTYVALVESASVQTSFSACDRKSEFSHSYPETTPPSLSHKGGDDSQEGVAHHRSRSGDDVTGSACAAALDESHVANGLTEEFDDKLRARLRGTNTEDRSTPELHPDIIQKLSKEEWKQLISYTCSTLGRSLLASILKQPSLLEGLIQADQGASQADHPSPGSSRRRHPRDHPPQNYKLDIESVLKKLQETDLARSEKPTKKLERTCSLPPLYNCKVKHDFENEICGVPGVGDGMFGLSDGKDVGSNVGNGQAAYQADQSEASGDNSEHRRSPGEVGGRRSRREREQVNSRYRCSHSKCHSGSGRKMRGRSRSDSVRDPNSLVDASLDDDGPGLPENRVRRPRHHQHQHYVCKQCLEEFGSKGWNRGKMAKKGWCRKHSPDRENMNSSGSGGEHAPVGPEVAVSLDHVKALERSAELMGEDSGNDERLGQVLTVRGEIEGARQGTGHVVSNGGGGHREGRHHSRKKNGSWAHAGADNHVGGSSVPVGVDGRLEGVADSQDFLELSMVSSRSGRDSPATDMAVCCLDLNKPRMLQPLGHQRQGHNGSLQTAEWEDMRHIYLHNHQHYHHIIHHSQP